MPPRSMKRRVLWFFLGWFLLAPAQGEAGKLADFTGTLDIRQGTLTVEFRRGKGLPAKLSVHRGEGNAYQAALELNNIATPFFEISTHLTAEGESRGGARSQFPSSAVKISSRYTLVNQKPVPELSAQLLIRGEKIFLTSLAWGTGYMTGELEMVPPYPLNLRVQFSDLPLSSFLALVAPEEQLTAEGEVSGDLTLTGPVGGIYFKGRLAATSGSIEAWAFYNIDAQIEGFYPRLEIRDSLIAQVDGLLFKATGSLDLADKETWAEQFSALAMDPIVEADGQTSGWTLKRLDSGEKAGTTELKYRLRQKEDVQTLSDEDADMIEIERKMKF